jgi:DNA recombination protein RmuC
VDGDQVRVTEVLIFCGGLLAGVLLTLLLRRQPPPPPLPPPVEFPVEPFDRLDARLREVEQARARAQGEVDATLRTLLTQTASLTTALKAPQVRGRWGEVQLKRVVEIAGMVEHVDFDEQATLRTTDGRLRPDMIVRLPNGRTIVIDSKTPLKAYLESLESASESDRIAKLREHASQVRTHISKLSEKTYWRQLDSTPEFVVCFLPGETFFSAALEQDPSLIEFGAANRVILATPTTLISLLKAVAYGWNQEKVAEGAQEISELGRTLYERLASMADHFAKLGDGLNASVRAYNQALGSLESRVLPSARRFEELGAAGPKPIRQPEPVDVQPRDARQTGLDL